MEQLQKLRPLLQSRYRLVFLVLLSPLLSLSLLCVVMSLPLLVFAVPAVLAAVGAYALFGPEVKTRGKRSVEVGPARDGFGAPRRNVRFKDALVGTKDGLTTIPQLMRATFEKYGSHPAMGTRKTIKIETKNVTVTVDGQEVTKKHNIPWKSDYTFNTFTDLGRDITHFGAGLMGSATQTPLSFGDKISIFASTRPEWQVSAQAAFEHGLVVVTVYPSLGPDALAYSLNQTECSHLICQASLMDVVARTAGSLKPTLKCVIYMDDLTPTQVQEYQKRLGRELLAWDTVMARGIEIARSVPGATRPKREPQPQDLAVIMYTSGSTGTPKGVMMSHANVVGSLSGIGAFIPEPINERDLYIAFLPLAHVLELTAEMCVLAYGGALGYSSPLTLRDDGVCDEQGRPAGDLAKLRPTIMAAVPLILDRLRAGVQEQLGKGSPITRIVFKTAFAIKLRAYKRGMRIPLLDKIVFSKVAARFGGRVRYLLSGGAPLSPETHEFTVVTVCAPVLQGYGLTETMSGGCITHPDDRTTGNVGAPVACAQLMLRDVPDMGYTSQDKPKPRGEILIGGASVTLGYFKLDQQTEEGYITVDGMRYFCTGDIGQWEEDGTLKIIDRKKDLVKLAHGEYIALGNLESKYAAAKVVDNICIVADSEHGAPIALVAPNHAVLKEVAAQAGVTGESSIDALCENPAVIKAVRGQLNVIHASAKMEKWEKVGALKMYSQPWTPESGLLTEAMKLKRHEIAKRFQDDITTLYKKVP